MASTDAKSIPQKNVALRISFPILDADGDLVTGAAGLDSEVSKDGGTFADCTNEATEIATSSGMYFLDLTSTEMNADTVAVIIKTSTSGAKTTPVVMYTAARSVNDLAYPTTSGRAIDVSAGGEVGIDWANIGSPTTSVALTGTTISISAVKKNTAFTLLFMITDSTNHAPKTSAASIVATRSLDGAAFGACANSVTEISSGWYSLVLAAADLNANCIALRVTSTSNDDVAERIITFA